MDEKKVREAIKALKITIDIGEQKIEYNKTFEHKNDNEPIEKSIEHAKTAIEALEKQLPKKVNYEGAFINNGFTRYRMAKCPTCERWYRSNDENNYCSGCGQKLDWSEN